MNLRYYERINRLTAEIIELRTEAERRKNRDPKRNVGAWRHRFNIEMLEHRAELLEKRRLALFRAAPNVLKGLYKEEEPRG